MKTRKMIRVQLDPNIKVVDLMIFASQIGLKVRYQDGVLTLQRRQCDENAAK